MFREIYGWSTAVHRLLDLELSLGSQSRCNRDGQSLLHDDRGAPGRLGRATRHRNGRSDSSCKASPEHWNCFTCRPSGFRTSSARPQDIPSSFISAIDQAGQRLPLDEQRPRRHRYDDGVRPGSHGDGTGGERGGNRGGSKISYARRDLSDHRPASRCRRIRTIRRSAQMEYAHHGDPLVPRQQRFGLYTRSLMKGLGVPVENRSGSAPRARAGDEPDCAVDRREGLWTPADGLPA